jgi:mono/diheme cytochrome c family protein
LFSKAALPAFVLVTWTSALSAEDGRSIYAKHCASCHGKAGEGVADKYDEPLAGDRGIDWLARYIDRSMPEDKPELLDAKQSALVAEYIYHAFYSQAARDKARPAKMDFMRLTAEQHQRSVTDLLGSFRGREPITETGGLKGRYTSADPKVPPPEKKKGENDDDLNRRRPKKNVERVDAGIAFDFGQGSPMGEELESQIFQIEWNGSVFAEESGVYEFILKSENGVRLWVNNEQDQKLIDGWVSSGIMAEHRASLHLQGGRFYPLRLAFFKYKDKSASVRLEWKPPHRPQEVIPGRCLSPRGSKELFVSTASFPPDDASAGYERGVSVSRAWDDAVTQTAMEAADYIVERLDRFSESKPDAPDRREKIRAMLVKLAERAFRRPVTEKEAAVHIDAPLASAGQDAAGGVRRSVLMILKSPHFIYPELAPKDDWLVAARASLILWDSVPPEDLQRPAARAELHTREHLEPRLRRMVKDARTRAKVHEFFHHWLHLDKADDIARDPKAYPDFTEEVAADLRTSLHLFLDEVVWSDDSDYRKLLLADHLYLNERLAKLYGAPFPEGAQGFQKVIPPQDQQRTGVITHPLLLSAFAYYKSSSPIHRGVFLTRNVLGRSLRPPITAIQFMDEKFDPHLTMREKVTQLTKSENCMACHGIINPLGFALEHYDAAGRFRTEENGRPVDASAEYTTAEGQTFRFTGPRDIAEHALSSRQARLSFISQLFHALVKQPAAAYGAGTLDHLHDFFVRKNHNIQELILEITTLAALHGIQPPST